MKRFFAFVLLCSAFSAQAESDIDLLLSAGITYGGDTLAETTDGTEVKAGGLIYGGIGGLYHVNENFDLQASFGYHFDSLETTDGSVDFDRFFIEVLPFFIINETMRFGIGISHTIQAEYSSPFSTLNFEDTTGVTVEMDWKIGSRAWWGIRYTSLDFTVNEFNGFSVPPVLTIDGSYLGLMVHVYL